MVLTDLDLPVEDCCNTLLMNRIENITIGGGHEKCPLCDGHEKLLFLFLEIVLTV